MVVTYIDAGSDMVAFRPTAISDDGSTVAGTMNLVSGLYRDRAAKWTRGGGVSPLPVAPGVVVSTVGGMSADGSIVVGSGGPAGSPGAMALRWLNDETAHAMTVGGTGSLYIGGITPSGSHVAITKGGETYLWRPNGTSTFVSSFYSKGIDASGRHLTGWEGFQPWGFSVWMEETTRHPLPALPGDRPNGEPVAISADGRVIVGNVHEPHYPSPFELRSVAVQWVDGVLKPLMSLTDPRPSSATSVSSDGSIIAGIVDGRPAFWVNGEYFSLQDWLATQGVLIGDRLLGGVVSMSINGQYLGGSTNVDGRSIGYVVRLPAPGATAFVFLGLCVSGRRRRARDRAGSLMKIVRAGKGSRVGQEAQVEFGVAE